MIVFDIETAALEQDAVLQFSKPFVEPSPPGEFDPASVKLGRMKDQAKIDALIESKRQEHAAAVEKHQSTIAGARQRWIDECMGQAALSPFTGRVLAIGYANEKGRLIDGDGDEGELIRKFWTKANECRAASRAMVGHNIFKFDLPFLIRRSWLLGVDFPDWVMDRSGIRRGETFIDTMQRWGCGQYGEYVSLDAISRGFGLNGKTNGVGGADFARLWLGNEEEHLQAREYLKNDLDLNWNVATRLGVV